MNPDPTLTDPTGAEASMHRIRGGFTLIELLVVISIIAVLAAMLVPAIALVKRQAENQKCLSGQKQVYLAAQSYATDQDGLLPDCALSAGRQWGVLIAPNLDTNNNTRGSFDSTVFFQSCPAFDRQMSGYAWSLNAYPNYGNASGASLHDMYWSGSSNWTPFANGSVTKPGGRVYIADSWSSSWSMGNPGTWYSIAINPSYAAPTASDWTYSLRHNQRMNVTFFDGHGGSLRNTDIVAAFSGNAE